MMNIAQRRTPLIAVHGGAWAMPEELWEDSIKGVKDAVLHGFDVLSKGGSALDAVQCTTISLENNPVFDAGTGSVLTYDEQVEMDAIIMDGRDLNCGAVAALKNIANPIKVARLVMDKTPHLLLVGEGANSFARANGIEEVSPDILVTSTAKEELARYKKFNTAIDNLFIQPKDKNCGHDTVGCVAMDSSGHLACATSTGGITAKLPGRVGDSPILGAGAMADDEIGAVSATGHGEAIMKACLAKSILAYMAQGHSPSSATKLVLDYMKSRTKGYGGAVVISNKGDVAVEFSTEKMAWAYIQDGDLHFGLHFGQHVIEKLQR